MNATLIEQVANAVLYEGYLLYPYRTSAVKNQQRFNFGVLFPEDDGDARERGESCFALTDVVARAEGSAAITARTRFLQVTGDTAEERDVYTTGVLDDLCAAGVRHRVGIGDVVADVELSAAPADPPLFTITLRVANVTPMPTGSHSEAPDRHACAMVSAHAILQIEGGEFLSLLDPPLEAAAIAAACRHVVWWPVLVGEEGIRDAMLAAPIILYDYPRIAPESAGDFFDGTEIDEMLALRVLTMTDAEKEEVRRGDPRGRRVLERTERSGAEDLLRLHGGIREGGRR